MKKLTTLIVALVALLVLDSCGSSKKITYFQNIDYTNLAQSRGLYDAVIMPKDLLTITVHTTDPDAAAPYNLSVSGSIGTKGELSGGSNSMVGYLVDNDGYINFPTVGKVKVAGLTKDQCQDAIRNKIKIYLNESVDPIVTVRLASYRVTVAGEVASPGVIPVSTEKMSVLEALAQAGDLTIYGKRDNVLLLREDEVGEKHAVRLDLTDANIINSPYYYVQQNDYIYVEPNKVKRQNSSIGASTTIWFSVVSILISTASLIYNIAN